MIFQRITKPDKETLKLFIPCRKNFFYFSKTAKTQLARLIKSSIFFYKVFDKNVFIGCLFVHNIDEKQKIIEFGGFADRRVNTCQAIKELIAFLKHHYPDFKIKVETPFLEAKICLREAGLTKTKEGYIYG